MDVSKTVEVPGPLLRAAGQALHGERWVIPLARTLGVGERTTERWAEAATNGAPYRVSRTLVEELVGHLQARASGVERAKNQLVQLLVR